MRRTFLFPAVAVAVAVLSFPVFDARAAQVEGLQFPAWLERAGQKQPLRPGMTLAEADRIETGSGGRVLIQLADGSFIRVGAQAKLTLERLDEAQVRDGVLTGTLSVQQGAIRYTTGASGRSPGRAIELRMAATTLMIRDADVWARKRDDSVTVCLIEGRVGLRQPARDELLMDQPSSLLVVPPDGERHPLALVGETEFRPWLAETDLEPGTGVMLPGGAWIVQLGAYANEADARRVEQRLSDAGMPAELTTVQLKERSFHRLRVTGFDARQDAQVFADRVKAMIAVPQPWVTCDIPGRSCQ